METTDVLVIGGGVVGLALALEAKRRQPRQRVVLLEAESACGRHASGRNSGILHAGIYYSAQSGKGRTAQTGNRMMTEYCRARGLPLLESGKLVVASTPEDLPGLEELHRRGLANGAPVELVDENTAREIEPRARTLHRALWSPSTRAVEPLRVMAALEADAIAAGIDIRRSSPFLGRRGNDILTPGGPLQAGFVFNAAGLGAVTVAQAFGFAADYLLLPFRGLYLMSDLPPDWLRVQIYPVPDLKMPFLGVHFTRTAHGVIKIGPTAIPALWPHQYGGLSGFDPAQCARLLGHNLAFILHGIHRQSLDFARMVAAELAKHRRTTLTALASRLVWELPSQRFRHWGPPGIRAQLARRRDYSLVMDFLVEGDDQSVHILNAVSPGFTSALPMARELWDRRESGGGWAMAGDGPPAPQNHKQVQP
ncbi:MAG: FAD-dependent oxidoreductase [Magnetococcus sp. WYHC-3]